VPSLHASEVRAIVAARHAAKKAGVAPDASLTDSLGKLHACLAEILVPRLQNSKQ
jgi:hypothetical protein